MILINSDIVNKGFDKMKSLSFLNFLLIYNILFMNYDDRLFHHVFTYILTYTITFILIYHRLKKLTHFQILMMYLMNLIATSYLDINYIVVHDEIDRWCHINIFVFAFYTIILLGHWCKEFCRVVIYSTIEQDHYKV